MLAAKHTWASASSTAHAKLHLCLAGARSHLLPLQLQLLYPYRASCTENHRCWLPSRRAGTTAPLQLVGALITAVVSSISIFYCMMALLLMMLPIDKTRQGRLGPLCIRVYALIKRTREPQLAAALPSSGARGEALSMSSICKEEFL